MSAGIPTVSQVSLQYTTILERFAECHERSLHHIMYEIPVAAMWTTKILAASHPRFPGPATELTPHRNVRASRHNALR